MLLRPWEHRLRDVLFCLTPQRTPLRCGSYTRGLSISSPSRATGNHFSDEGLHGTAVSESGCLSAEASR